MRQPALIVHPRDDDMASLKNAQYLQAHLGGLVDTLVLDDSYHMVTLDQQRHIVAERTGRFVSWVEGAIAAKGEIARMIRGISGRMIAAALPAGCNRPSARRCRVRERVSSQTGGSSSSGPDHEEKMGHIEALESLGGRASARLNAAGFGACTGAPTGRAADAADALAGGRH